jgi:hypothetical protein
MKRRALKKQNMFSFDHIKKSKVITCGASKSQQFTAQNTGLESESFSTPCKQNNVDFNFHFQGQ